MAASIYASDKFPLSIQEDRKSKNLNNFHESHSECFKKIKIGYFSADFRQHAVAYLIANFFELHDSEYFETTAFYFGPVSNDDLHDRISRTVDRFLDVRNSSDSHVAQIAKEIGIDIAVDLGGYTQYSRTGIFALKIAPIQVNFLGYPGTMGSEYYDYIIADGTLITKQDLKYYSEKIVFLPDTYQPNDPTRPCLSSDCSLTRDNIFSENFVFACFNNAYKITPEVFNCWMSILKAIQKSVLWLFKDNELAVNNLRCQAAIVGVDPERLIFAEKLPHFEHLARISKADLFLDTFPYNGHTTASDALWAGLPVLTRMGRTFPSRVAASLLNATGLSELVTQTQTDYVEKAIYFATQSEELTRLKKHLIASRSSSPLFNCFRFTRNIEEAYRLMYQNKNLGDSPQTIQISLSAEP